MLSLIYLLSPLHSSFTPQTYGQRFTRGTSENPPQLSLFWLAFAEGGTDRPRRVKKRATDSQEKIIENRLDDKLNSLEDANARAANQTFCNFKKKKAPSCDSVFSKKKVKLHSTSPTPSGRAGAILPDRDPI